MLSNGQHRSVLQTKKIQNMLKQVPACTLSPETSTTTSSGYSTGGSSVSTTINQSLKKSSSSSIASKQHHHQQQEHKTKSKGFNNIFTKLKNLLLPSKPKHIHSKTMRSSRQISSANILRQYRQYSPIYNVLPSSSLPINNAISLPFTYYYNSPIRQSKTNFEKISAWLNHTEKLTKNQQNSNDLSFIDTSQQQSTSSSSADIDNQGITVVMKKTPTNIKPPKRSSSLVTRITRPIIEHQSQKTVSPTSSFSSSILTKGMSERMTPPLPPQKSDNRSSKNNRRRTIDFSRRRTIVDDTTEHKSNKENFSIKNVEKSSQPIYQFSPLLPNKKTEIHIPSTKHVSTKKYYFHSNKTKTNEDLLNNSYGLALLNQQQEQQKRHSTATVLMISQVPNQISSQKQFNPRSSIQEHTLDSLDDLLCDREVESYFYPTSSSQSEHIYMNLENPLSLSYIHGTLC